MVAAREVLFSKHTKFTLQTCFSQEQLEKLPEEVRLMILKYIAAWFGNTALYHAPGSA